MSALPVADDPATGGPTFSCGFCFFPGGLDADDEDDVDDAEEEDEDELR